MKLIDYMAQNRLTANFGIKYLDDKLEGILQGDLILLGARSGAGKSTIADIIATHNAKQGRKVTLISLENFEGDNLISKAYYKYKELTKNYNLTIRQFASGRFDMDKKAFAEAEKYANEQYAGMQLINRQKGYTIENLFDDIVGAVCKESSQLVIIDHIDYLDKEDNDNEIKHITRLMKTIRNAQYDFKVPVIAISHLRKPSTQKLEVKVPSVDEFIGSSNKVKEATCVIMLAPDEDDNLENMDNLKSTWCCIRKLRMGGYDNKVARIMFNTDTGKYEDDYEIFKVNYTGTAVQQIQQKYYGFPNKK